MNTEELNDAYLHAAATMAVAFSYGCSIKSCRIIDGNSKWPTPGSDIWIAMGDDWTIDDEIILRPAIHEAGAMAVARSHRRLAHVVRIGGEEANEQSEMSAIPRSGRRSKPSLSSSRTATVAEAKTSPKPQPHCSRGWIFPSRP